MKKIAIVFGTRPEAIKLIPVYKELKKSNQLDVILISTGQHKEMLDQILSFFEVDPDISLDVMKPNQSLAYTTSQVLSKMTDVLQESEIDCVITQGDTTTCFAASLAAFYLKIKVAHVEAGLRTNVKYNPFPEEINRRLTSVLADFHFVPTVLAKENLIKENISGNIFVVGNTVIDALLQTKAKTLENELVYENKFEKVLDFNKRIVLITGHRRESIGEGFRNICNAIKFLSKKYNDIIFYYPVHLNPKIKDYVSESLSNLSNVIIDKPLAYDDFIYVMNKSYMILTDSGGIQEEAPSLNVPLLVMRETTERPEGIIAGCSILCGTSEKEIVLNCERIIEDESFYDEMIHVKNPYGDGNSSVVIREVLESHL